MTEKSGQKFLCNILYLSKDKEVSKLNSFSSIKLAFLSQNLGELHVVYPGGLNKKVEKRGEHFFVYPTRFKIKIMCLLESIRIAFFQVTWRFHFRAQLVFSEDPVWTGLAGYFIALQKKRPLVVLVEEDVLSPVYRFSSVWRFLNSLVADFVISHSNFLIVSSNRIKESILNKYGDLKGAIEVLPRPIDPEKINKVEITKDAKSFFKDPGFIITMAGPFFSHKRIKMAVDVFKRILKRYPRINLLLVGDGPGSNFVKRLARNQKFKGKIACTKMDEDFHSILRTSHLFLITSTHEDSDGFAIDALSASLPVVSTDTGVIRDLLSGLKYERYITKVDDYQGIFNRILELIENVGIRDDYRLNARDLINDGVIIYPEDWGKSMGKILCLVSRNDI